MNTRRLMFALAFALLCSGLLTWQLSRHLPRESTTRHPTATRQIVTAAKDVHEGDSLTNTSLGVVTLPETQQLVGTFQNPTDLVGRTLQVSISSGEPILARDLAPITAGTGLAVSIPPGMRAVSVHALEDSGTNSGFIVPGSHIDLLVTYRPSNSEGFVSSVVLQDAHVLAVGQNKEGGAEDKLRSDGSLTLLLSPDEAARLMAASSLGKLTVALRNGMDRTTSNAMLRVTFDGKSEAQPKQPPARRQRDQTGAPDRKSAPEFHVETLAGGKATVQTFRGDQ